MTGTQQRRQRRAFINIIMWLADLIAIWLAVIILMLILDYDIRSMMARIVLILATVAYVPTCWYMSHGDALLRNIPLDKVFINSFKAIVIHALTFMSLSAFIHIDYSITFYCSFYLILCVAFPLINLMCRKLIKQLRRKGRNSVRVAIVGTNMTARRLGNAMTRDAGFGYRVIGYFNDTANGEPLSQDALELADQYIGNLEKLEEYVSEHRIDEIYFTLVGEGAENMSSVVKLADRNLVQFYYVPQISRYVTGTFSLQNIGSIPVMTLLRNPLSSTFNRILKRSFDLAFSSLVLIFSPLIFLPVAVGIKISSPGPVFFRQERTGFKGKSFKCYKFRTMRVNTSADSAQATANDPRKTRFGDFLRRSSIDELPQFINVWLGEMSVVGPRPHMLKHTEDYGRMIDKYMVRHVVKPGITGWAQVNGFRGITDQLWKMEKRVEHDVWYIENWTFSLDLKIVVRTVINAVRGEKNAF